ncbi:MAG: response regulator [Desulfuromonadales bacterium]|nr:response regulator [Desulfuromonadales bacterium]
MLTPQDSVFVFFQEEAAEHLSVLEAGLLQLEKNSASCPDLAARLLRAAHTLKGAANLVKLTSVGAIVHEIEGIFETFEHESLFLGPAEIDVLLSSLDHVRTLIRQRSHDLPSGEDPEPRVLIQLRAIASSVTDGPLEHRRRDGPEDVGTEKAGSARRTSADKGVLQQQSVKVSVEKIEALVASVGEFTLLKNRMAERTLQFEKIRAEISIASEKVAREAEDFGDTHDNLILTPANNRLTGPPVAAVDCGLDQYDSPHLFAKRMCDMASDMRAAIFDASRIIKELTEDVAAMDRVACRMKEEISHARTVSADFLFGKFERTIRDLSVLLDKPVELSVRGGATLIDRVIADGLFDPLLHIIRNAIAHGIESPASRSEAGKPLVATLGMTAEQKGDSIEIVLSDDGQGLDLERIRARAVALGYVDGDMDMADSDLVQLIFQPGLSTSHDVNETSGRGVGMSVVLDRLATLNGTVDVETVRGKGTAFRMRLPLSLVVVNVIKFVVAEHSFALPSALVDEIVDLRYELPRTARGALLERAEVVDLGSLFELKDNPGEPRFGIFLGGEGDPLLLLVDRLSGQEDTVIKPFGSFIGQHPYFSGCSLTGDGILRPVVNPVRMVHRMASRKGAAAVPQSGESAALSTVLIVDDSPSVRKYVSRLVELDGFRVVTAVDGREALDIVDREQIDSIITDLEMPGMHGYELLDRLNGRSDRRPPVAVLSARSGERDQLRALGMGATDYLVKPVADDVLIAVVRKHLRRGEAL